MANDTERGRKPLHVAALMAAVVLSAFVLIMAAAGITQTAAARRPRTDFARRLVLRPPALLTGRLVMAMRSPASRDAHSMHLDAELTRGFHVVRWTRRSSIPVRGAITTCRASGAAQTPGHRRQDRRVNTIRSESIEKSMLTAPHDFVSCATFFRKARTFKARSGTARLSSPGGPPMARRGARFGHSVFRYGQP